MMGLTPKTIRSFSQAAQWDREAQDYLAFHAARYAFLFNRIDAVMAAVPSKSAWRILDVGPGPQTTLLREYLTGSVIDSLGFADNRHPCRTQDRHYPMDLNHADDSTLWPIGAPYDLILLAEVIEHLTVAPQIVLRGLRECMGAGGHLVLQTPNACALPKRLRMMRGQNPFEMIREIRHNPGHYREYTVAELLKVGRDCGLVAEQIGCANYFAQDTRMGRWFQRCEKLIPPTWRYGITVVFRRDDTAPVQNVSLPGM